MVSPRGDSTAPHQSEELSDSEFYLNIAMLLKSVRPEIVGIVVGIIVDQIARHNERVAAGVKVGGETSFAETETNNSLQPEAPATLSATTPTPWRDYRDAQGKDHGYAVREQYLNPPPDPWASN